MSSGSTLVMSSFNSVSQKENKAAFWKKNSKNVPGSIKPVYGAQHPPRQEKPSSSEQGTPKRELRKPRDSFQDFQANTEDAWDAEEDDLMHMANVKLSLKDVQSTALQVINNHSQQRLVSRDEEQLSRSLPERDHNNWASPVGASGPTGTQNQTVTAGNRHGGPGVGVRLYSANHPTRPRPTRLGSLSILDRESSKMEKLKTLLAQNAINLDELRKLCWSGIPKQYRPVAWKLLSGYIPPALDRRELTLQRKRKEYYSFIDQYYDTRHQDIHQETFRQIHIDIPRMSPLIPIFQQTLVQEIFERILYIWAIRHPASGYVQGINDLVTPFFVVFLCEYISNDTQIDSFEVGSLPSEQLRPLEADSFWCFSKLLDGIQDNYTFAQPGIQNKVRDLRELISRIDSPLHHHLEDQNVEYLQFAFRWMNNLLMRELPLHCVIRLWDTYLSEPNGFASFHLYACAALVTRFSQELKHERDFQGLMLMLQNLPTHNWRNEEVSLLLAEAYKLKFMYADAPKHLQQK